MPDLEYITIDYSSNENEFKAICNNKDVNFNFIKVTKIPTAQCALQLISQDWFKSLIRENDELLGVNMEVNEIIDQNFKGQPHFFEFDFKDSFIISYQSLLDSRESMTYLKVPSKDKFFTTLIDNDKDGIILKFLHEFLLEELSDGDSGILQDFHHKDEIRLQDFGTASNSNLLMIAAYWSRPEVVQALLLGEFDIDFENTTGQASIDKAWVCFEGGNEEGKKIAADIMLCLLKSNSRLPLNFVYEEASKEVQNFVSLCEILHENVDKNDFDSLTLNIEKNKNLCHFYNRNNESLMLHALKTEKFKIIDFLEMGICTGPHEELCFLESYQEVHKNDLLHLRDQHKVNAKELPKTYILILRSKTKVGNNDRLLKTRLKCVEDAYNILDKNNLCSLLLQVAAQIKSIKILFDFKHESVYYLNPLKKITVLGTSYPNGTIYIGAKNFEFESVKFTVLATLAHELCHLAILMTYMNTDFNPFPMGDSEQRRYYISEVVVQCLERKQQDSIVENAFGYADHLIYSELIVTVAQMLIFYFNNPEHVKKLEVIFEKLFNYVNEIVKPELKKAIKVLNKLEDGEINIKYESLTDTMKQSFLHFSINFQGVDTTFYDLLGGYDACLKHLKSEDIRDIIKNGGIKISEMCKNNLKYSMIERNFMNRNKYLNIKYSVEDNKYEVEVNSKDLFQIRQNSKIFVLSDFGGTGKTTFFKHSAVKIKKMEPNNWISYINLRKFDDVFEDYEGKSESEINRDIFEILFKIIKIDNNNLTAFEKELFKKLFAKNQVILFLDGVDEVCPKHTDTLMKFLTSLHKRDTKNEIWISTRPHYAEKIEKIFNIRSICFVLYSTEQKIEFIMDILIKHGITDDENKINAIRKINSFITQLNWEPGYFYDPDHPLIIEIITELFIQKKLNLDATSYYQLYAAMIDKQKEKIGNKIPNIERDIFSSLSVWQVHQALAILVIIGHLYYNTLTYTDKDGNVWKEGFNFVLEELSIIKKWKIEKESGRWTSDMIQRYGFVTVDINEPVEKRHAIDFSHKTYAEFFVARYLIDFLFNNNFDEWEMIKMMRIVQIVQGTPDLVNVGKFIFSYMSTVARKEKQVFHREIKNVLIERIKKTLTDLEIRQIDDHSDPFIFFSKIISCDDELTKQLWQLESPRNSFDKIILNDKNTNLELIIETCIYVFGEDWHKRLSKNDSKLISDDKIEEMRDKVVKSWELWKFDKNTLKICVYIQEKFDIETQKSLHEKFINHFNVSNSKVFMEIIIIMSQIYDRETFTRKCFDDMFYTDSQLKSIEFTFSEIERLYIDDRDAIRQFLFEDYKGESSSLWNSIFIRNIEIFSFVKDFYIKYSNNYEEIQEIILEIETCELVKYGVTSELFIPFTSFILEIFKGDMAKLNDKIKGEEFEVTEEYVGNLVDFVNMVEKYSIIESLNDPSENFEMCDYSEDDDNDGGRGGYGRCGGYGGYGGGIPTGGVGLVE